MSSSTIGTSNAQTPSSPVPADEEQPALKLAILPVIKEKQLANGLRNGNYLRYHHYCTKKLRKLRQKLNLSHGTKFEKKDAPTVKDFFATLGVSSPNFKSKMEQLRGVQFLSLVLFQAERAWSYAVQLKQDIAEKEDRRKYMHQLKRLAKAAKMAAKLEQLCKEAGDKRTQLEAEAYSAYMQGTFLLEKENWKDAQEKFVHARTIYDNLSKVGRTALKEIYQARVEEIDPSIRFCFYNLNREKSAGARGDDIITVIESSDNPALDFLKSKLDHVLEESRKDQAKSMDEIDWNGRKIVVENEKVRLGIVNAEAIKNEINNCKTYEAKMRLYDKLFITLGDCQKLIRDDIKNNTKKDNEKFISNMRFLYNYLNIMQLERTIDRNLAMVTSMLEKINEQDSGAGDESISSKKQKVVKKATYLDVVRLYEMILHNLDELQQLPGIEDNDTTTKDLKAKQLLYKAIRCYCLGKEYSNREEWKEVFALYDRSEKLSEQAKAELQKTKLTKELQEATKLQQQLREDKCVAKAKFVLRKAQQQQQQDDIFEQRGTAPTTTTTTDDKDVLNNLDNFKIDRKGKPFLTAFPPNFEPIPAKPTFFDIAGNNIKYPDITSKLGSQKKWFGFW